jgi:hypothetical protein
MSIGGVVRETLKATDADGDPLTFAITREPRHSTVRLDAQTGMFRFTHDVGFVGGTFAFEFSATDPSGKSDFATVLIWLQPVRVTSNCR